MMFTPISFRSIVLLSLSVYISPGEGVRVCPSWLDYINPFSAKCFDNPDGEPANITQILQRWGCTVEEHELLTKDDYFILVVRAVMGSITKPTPIVMGHGLNTNTLSFVTMFNKTLAFELLQSGYQVFFINFRGTRYSDRHKTLTKDNEDYWKFSFHQMGEFDIPAAMDLVENKTSGTKAVFIGFSMANTAVNIYSILYPEESKSRLSGIIEMAPVANLTGMRSALKYFTPLYPVIKLYLPVSLEQNMDVVSEMLFTHYYQIYEKKQFLEYDYGPDRNKMKYGSAFPPQYNLTKISVPVALVLGLNDYIAEVKNGRSLYHNMPTSSRCGFKIIADTKWSHNSFVLSKDMPRYLNSIVMKIIPIMENNLCLRVSASEDIP
ncbi:lysosomal acid lipase/cholesteryl ester hydrolase isoform X2 [Leptinotarsa decemlineata]|uniref:lysosomal acid lipase/cholesteryl ester hydrolase isoform X2 n=1 Tax=Leptinotarsa decemlineata TaxID=7539 RepID=UPI003D306418